MEQMKFFLIGHEDHVFCNPLAAEKVDELVGLLDLPDRARVLDVACGRGELLRRIASAHSIRGVGIDLEAQWIDEATAAAEEAGLAEGLEFVRAAGETYVADDESFDLSMCIGASWIWKGHRETLRALARWTRPGGLIVVGEPFWHRPPTPAYLEMAELTAELCTTHADNVEIGTALGLDFLHAIVSSPDDWDRYEGYQWRAIERYARRRPDDADVPELLARVRRERDAYLRWGREELGWAAYVFVK